MLVKLRVHFGHMNINGGQKQTNKQSKKKRKANKQNKEKEE